MQPSALGTAAHAERATAAEREAQILAQVRPLELLALDGMRSADEETDTGAPLLSDERNYGLSGSHGDDGESAPAGSLAASRGDSGTWFIWALTLSAGLSGLLFGYDTGVISSTLVSIGSDLSNRTLTTLDKSLITSSTSLFALIASPMAGVLGDKLGRKPVIVIADVLFIAGAVWQSVTNGVWGMIFGRSLIGLAVGAASLVTPLYISELSPSYLRGRMVTILSLFITGGQCVAYVIGWLLSEVPSGWRWMVGFGALPAMAQLLILFLLPETPRWLMKANQSLLARRILRKVYGDTESNRTVVDHILRGIEIEIQEEEEERNQKPLTMSPSWLPPNWASLFQIGYNRRALTIACLLQGLQQLSGFNSVMYFSATIFSMLSFSSPTLTSLSVAVTNFLFTLLAFVLIDRIGRRRMLLVSIPIMTLALLLCAAAFSTMDLTPSSSSSPPPGSKPAKLRAPLVVLLALTLYTASYACGIGTIPWQQSELFPLSVRALGSALATATNWSSNFIVGLTFLPLMELISPGGTFVVYTAVCGLGLGAIWLVYPEMSGLGLEDVRGLLADGWGVSESLAQFKMRRDAGI